MSHHNDDDDDPQFDLFGDDSEAFRGLSDEVKQAIREKVSASLVQAMVALLSKIPIHADAVRRGLLDHPDFPAQASHATQLRKIRAIHKAALASGHPVCGSNAGYALGTATDLRASARRARRLSDGSLQIARMQEQLAFRYPDDDDGSGGSSSGSAPPPC